MANNHNDNNANPNSPQLTLLDNMRQKIEMWREEAENQPDRSPEMIAWAEHFSEMAKYIYKEETSSSGNKTHTPPPNALRNQKRFDNPDWMNDTTPKPPPPKIALKM